MFRQTSIAYQNAHYDYSSAVIAISVASDRLYYQQWTFPPIRFIHFNVVQSLAVFYGANRTDYYFTEGLPLLLMTTLPFALLGIFEALSSPAVPLVKGEDALVQTTKLRSLAASVLTMLVILSIISHKEVRFIYPLLPMLIVLAARPFARFQYKRALLTIIVPANIAFAAYVSLVHQRGVVDVTHYLRHEYEQKSLHHTSTSVFDANAAEMTVGFLMPCHSTPWRSHLVYPGIKAWALTCEPPIHVPLADRGSYLDEADEFYAYPDAWLGEHMESLRHVNSPGTADFGLDPNDGRVKEWPQYLVFFEQLEPVLEKKLSKTGYKECWRGFNSHFHDDWRRKGDVVVWCLGPSAT